MKKVLLLAAVAGVALASCTKNEVKVSNDQGSEISFTSPVLSKLTKAVIDGHVYPTSEKFNVWAIYSGTEDLSFTDIETSSNWTAFMTKVEVGHAGTAPEDYWASTGTKYYWPKAGGKLTFQAVSPSSFDADINWAAHKITAGSYTVGDDDILFSNITANKQEADYTSGFPYDDKATPENATYKGVDINFRHALSLILFEVKKGTKTNPDATEEIVVEKIKVANPFKTGSALTVTGTDFSTFTVDWGTASDKETYTFGSDVIATQSDYTQIGNSTLVLPQSIANDVKVTVTYHSVIDGKESDPASSTVQVNTLKDSHGNKINAWEWGKKYIYRILFNENELIFDPAVEDWEETVTMADINI